MAQTTKPGYVFLFDRTTGKPLFPIEIAQVPPSDVPGEVAAETQPLPTKPAPFARQSVTEDMLTNRTPEAHRWAVEQFRKFLSGGQFVPLASARRRSSSLVSTAARNGAAPAFDPETGLLYVNSNEMAWTAGLAETRHRQVRPAAVPARSAPTATARTAPERRRRSRRWWIWRAGARRQRNRMAV